MALKHSIFLPTGFVGELGPGDPVASYELLSTLVRAAEEAGFDTAWMPDHLHTIPPSQSNLFESWTLTASFLRATTRLRVGQLVTGVAYRHPVVQAKMAATADVIGNGRLAFGIGAGWYEPDYLAMGLDFADAPTRLRQLREAVQIITSLWTEDVTNFEGEFYRVRDAIGRPRGVQRPHIPIMIAGGGERVTLRIAAQYAAACNMLAGPEDLERKFAILRRHCETVGTSYDAIRKTATAPVLVAGTDAEALAAFPPGGGAMWDGDVREYGLIGAPATIRERMARYEAAGVEELILAFISPDPVATLRQYAAEFISAPVG